MHQLIFSVVIFTALAGTAGAQQSTNDEPWGVRSQMNTSEQFIETNPTPVLPEIVGHHATVRSDPFIRPLLPGLFRSGIPTDVSCSEYPRLCSAEDASIEAAATGKGIITELQARINSLESTVNALIEVICADRDAVIHVELCTKSD